MQWNCRGLSNKISEFLVFLKEKDIGIVCLNKVKIWHNKKLSNDYFVVKFAQFYSARNKSISMVRNGAICLPWRPGLTNKPQKFCVHKPVIKRVNSFLSQKSIFVKINNSKSSTFSTLAGVPQGSVIASILFLVYVSGISDKPTQISQFADDLALYYRPRSCRIIQLKLQYSLDKLIKWCKNPKIRLNPGN